MVLAHGSVSPPLPPPVPIPPISHPHPSNLSSPPSHPLPSHIPTLPTYCTHPSHFPSPPIPPLVPTHTTSHLPSYLLPPTSRPHPTHLPPSICLPSSLQVKDDSGAYEAILIAPSVTPYVDQNPSYRVFEMDPDTYELLDYQQFHMNLTKANGTAV